MLRHSGPARRVRRRALSTVLAAFAAAALGGLAPPPAGASQLIDRNVRAATLAVDARGEAMISYRDAGTLRHVLAWGAVNALPPTADVSQVKFHLDYSGGYGKYRALRYWQAPGWSCLPYTGPVLAWIVAACDARDGSYWALQAWQRELPDLGVDPSAAASAWELHLSHWSGPLPVLSITLDWSYHRFDHLFGTLTYHGAGVYGFHSTSTGVPLDGFGRNVYVDTYDSAYGKGWRRENSFLTHRPGGSFCYGFYPHGDRPTGKGTRYRATVVGPGVTPDVTWQGVAPGPYSASVEATAGALQKQLGDPSCVH